MDIILGTSRDEQIFGEADADLIIGQGGSDRLDGGPGDDVVFGGLAVDVSSIMYQISQATFIQSEDIQPDNPIVNVLDSKMSLSENYRDMTLANPPRAGQTLAIGGQGNDLVIAHTSPPGGDRAINQLFGDEFTTHPRGGDDILIGSPYVDVMTGGRGDDIFFVLRGGQTDIITDFGLGNDRLGLVTDSAVRDLEDIANLFASFDVALVAGDSPYTEIQVSIYNPFQAQNEIVGLVLENYTHPLVFEDFQIFTQAEFDGILRDAETTILNEFT